MSRPRFTPEFKDEAARQFVDCGYPVVEVSEGLGVSGRSLYKWIKAVRPGQDRRTGGRPGRSDGRGSEAARLAEVYGRRTGHLRKSVIWRAPISSITSRCSTI
jgi:transposase-like protein